MLLPAPFGPMIEAIWPRRNAAVMPFSAVNPPNRLPTFSVRRMMSSPLIETVLVSCPRRRAGRTTRTP